MCENGPIEDIKIAEMVCVGAIALEVVVEMIDKSA